MDAVTFVNRARAETLGEVYRQTPQEISRGETRVRSAIRRIARNAPMVLDERELGIIGFEDAFVLLALADGEAFPGKDAETNLLSYKQGGDRTLFTRAKLIFAVIKAADDEPWTDPIERKYLPVITNAVGVAMQRGSYGLLDDTALINRFARDQSYGPVIREQVVLLYAQAEKIWADRPRYNFRR